MTAGATTPIGAGFLGGGFMAAVHSRAARAARARLVAVASSALDRSEAAAAQLGIESADASAEALLARDDIDVVHVCTPNASHASLASAAIAAGRHVVCEKPLATSAADARRLADELAASGLVGGVPFVYRYHPQVREARARVARGELGALLTLDAAYLQDWLLGESDGNWRADAVAGGPSRAFADIGSHLADLIEFVTGERIVRLSARTRTVYSERGGVSVSNEDIAALVVELSGGALGTLLISQMSPGRKNGLVLELHGAAESLRFEQERPEELWVGRRDGSSILLRDAATAAPEAERFSIVPSGHPMGYQDAFTAFVDDVYAVIRGEEREGMPTFADGARAAVITEVVLESAATAQWIEVPA
ncbi:Gfo/Idh/MocA family protein [Agromyces atrinae]|uniref:Gfo/Idh/MocA family oxidoreductase n=1 Tax=Agromyces atrinae TaxID=592376 RepID=A0A4Q2M4H0_9MICO|nr:Gfo/Idh/MocA family oxidoreductase [Agromyces atrinae]NYD67202.1 putative dehydrogenase [Agromyces atrinae]RXZ86964.1 Gfo/Idh/MocA family oxidoreductase [Agromyces atrinae]